MSISINPEYSGGITTDCAQSYILGHAVKHGPAVFGTYASGVSDWYNCLTTGLSQSSPPGSLGGLSIYQWIVVNWLQSGDTFVVVHEPTTMAQRRGEDIGGGGCSPTAPGNTCPNDWLYNFLCGGGSSACTSATANNHNVIQ
jgi:hypothetical protein